MEGVSVLGLAQSADDKQTGIFGSKALHARDPVGDYLAFLLAWLFICVFRRHVARFYLQRHPLPEQEKRGRFGILQDHRKRHPTFLPVPRVAARTIGIDERRDLVLIGLHGLG